VGVGVAIGDGVVVVGGRDVDDVTGVEARDEDDVPTGVDVGVGVRVEVMGVTFVPLTGATLGILVGECKVRRGEVTSNRNLGVGWSRRSRGRGSCLVWVSE
jgi:hypothetical protein